MVLNAMREGAKSGFTKFVLMGFMVLATAGLVMMDVGGFFRSGVGTDSVIKIGNNEISAPVFDNQVKRTLARQSLDPQTAWQLGFIDQIVNAEINNKLLYMAAHDLGIEVGDEVVVKQINDFLAPLVSDGMSKKEAFQRFLFNQGMSEQQFVQTLKVEIATALLRSSLASGVAVTTDQEAKDLYQFQNEEREVRAIIFPNSSITDYDEPTDDVLMPLYQAGQERYAIPELRSFTVAVLGTEALKSTIEITDEELQEIYQKDILSYEVPEQRTLDQAVLGDNAQALAVVEKLTEGMSLKEAVSSVTGSEDAYLGKDEFTSEGLVKEIASKAFAAERGDVVGPVQTPLGFHVLVVDEIHEPTTKPFAEVKDQLREEIVQNRVADEMFAMGGAIDDELAAGTPLEDVAESMNLTIKQYGPVREDGSTQENTEGFEGFDKDKAYILQTAFELLEDESAPVMELSDGSYAVVRVDEITPKSYKPFEEVRDSLAEIWTRDQQYILNKQRVQDVLNALGNEEKTFADIANEYGFEVKTYKLKRNEKAPEDLTDAAQSKFFEYSEGSHAVGTLDNGFVVGEVLSVTIPDTDDLTAEDLADIKKNTSRGAQNEYLTAYVNHLRGKYGVKVNRQLLQKLYGPGSETY